VVVVPPLLSPVPVVAVVPLLPSELALPTVVVLAPVVLPLPVPSELELPLVPVPPSLPPHAVAATSASTHETRARVAIHTIVWIPP
jgi:hypothetical protein